MEQRNLSQSRGVAAVLIKFAVPVLLANILQVVYSATDLLILGNFAAKADVSGATISSQIMQLITLGVSGFSVGLMIILGQFSGAKNEEGLASSVGTAIPFFAAVSVIILIPLQIFNRQLISIMQTPPEAFFAASSYLRICGFGILFIIGYNVSGAIFRGLGNSKMPLLFAGIACAINVILDLVFVLGFSLGASGAAVATVIAQGCSVSFAFIYIKIKGLGFTFTRKNIRPNRELIKRIVKLGAPISLQEILVTFSFLLITAVVNKMGVVASASVGIVEKLIGFLVMPSMAMASSVAAISAQHIGAGEPRRAEKCMWTGILIALAIAVPITILCFFRGELPISIFGKDPEILQSGSSYLKTYVFDSLGLAFVFVFNGFFSSCNRSVFAMAHSLIVTFLIRVPAVLILSRIPGVTLLHIGLAAPMSTLVSLILCLAYFFKVRRTSDYLGTSIKSVH